MSRSQGYIIPPHLRQAMTDCNGYSDQELAELIDDLEYELDWDIITCRNQDGGYTIQFCNRDQSPETQYKTVQVDVQPQIVDDANEYESGYVDPIPRNLPAINANRKKSATRGKFSGPVQAPPPPSFPTPSTKRRFRGSRMTIEELDKMENKIKQERNNEENGSQEDEQESDDEQLNAEIPSEIENKNHVEKIRSSQGQDLKNQRSASLAKRTSSIAQRNSAPPQRTSSISPQRKSSSPKRSPSTSQRNPDISPRNSPSSVQRKSNSPLSSSNAPAQRTTSITQRNLGTTQRKYLSNQAAKGRRAMLTSVVAGNSMDLMEISDSIVELAERLGAKVRVNFNTQLATDDVDADDM